MSAASKQSSANQPQSDDLALLEPQALAAWIPEIGVDAQSAKRFFHPQLRDQDILSDLETALEQEDLLENQAIADATRLSVARWSKVHCAQPERGEAALATLSNSKIASFCSDPQNELWDRSVDMASLRKQSQDLALPKRQRCWAALELGLLQQECGHALNDVLDSYLVALECIPSHLVALELAWRCAAAKPDKALARDLLGTRLSLAKSLRLPEDPGLRRCMGSLWNKASEVREHLDQIHAISPDDTHVAQRRIARAFMDQKFDGLPDLFLALAGQGHAGLELQISALHLCLLTTPPDQPIGQELLSFVLETFARANASQDKLDSATIAMMREFAERMRCGSQELEAATRKELRSALSTVAEHIDDPRDQALIHEQLARMSLRALRDEPRGVLTASDIAPVLHSLQVCADLLPDLRWNREATAEVLGRVQNYPALAQHFESWASDSTHSSERANLLLRAGQVYEYDLGEYALALECYRQAHAEQPRNPACLRALGGCYARCAQWNDAVSVLHQQLDQAADEYEREACLRRIVNIARYEIQDADLALASLQQLTELRPDDIGSLYLTAAIARREDRMGVLVDALQRLVALTCDPISQATLASELASVLDQRLDRHDEAVRWHMHALAANPSYAPSRREICRYKSQRGEYQSAVSMLMDTDPAQMDAEHLFHALLAAQRLGMQDPLRLEIYTAAADQLSPSPALHEQSARMLIETGDYRQAYTLLERVCESSFAPLAAEQHFDLGRAAQGLTSQDLDHADHWRQRTLVHFHRCLELEPEHYGAQEELYHLYSQSGDLGGLEKLYTKIEEHLDPVSRVQALAYRARVSRFSPDNKEQSRALYEQALMLFPGDNVLRFELEQVLRASGSARALFNNLVRQAGEISDAKLKSSLAICAAETLLDAGSGTELKTIGRLVLSALKGDPGNPHAVSLLERVISLDPSVVPVRAAVSARAVRAQSDQERAVFFAESAELLEQGHYYRDAKAAYQAAQELVSGTMLIEQAIERVERSDQQERGASPAAGSSSPTHRSGATKQQSAVQQAIERDDEDLAGRIVANLTGQLAENPDNPEAIYALVQLASAHLQRPTILRALAQLFVRLTNRGCRYRAGVLLGIHCEDAGQGASYLNAALSAKPDGLSAREALLGRYREMGDLTKQADTIRALLAHPRFTEARKPALQRELVHLLANDASASAEALRHCAELLREQTRDTDLIQLYSTLLERQGRLIDAAHALEPLLSDAPSPDLVHQVRLRQTKLYAQRSDTMDAAINAGQAAIAAKADDAETLELLLGLCDQSDKSKEIDGLVETIRIATVRRITKGNATPKDLDNLSKLLITRSHPAKRRLQVLHEALVPLQSEPRSLSGAQAKLSPIFRDPQSRERARSSAEPSDLMELLALLEQQMPQLRSLLEELSDAHLTALPPNAVAPKLSTLVRNLAKAMNIKAPIFAASSRRGMVTLISGKPPEFRFSSAYWDTKDLELGTGLVYLATARYLNQGPMIRALGPETLDLVIAAAFDLAGVFHPITAEPDAESLEKIKQRLGAQLSNTQLRNLQKKCIAMQDTDLPPGFAKEASLKSDLRLCVLLSKDPRTILLTAAALDQQTEGPPIERICNSPVASTLLGDFLSDEAMNRKDGSP